jgi:hypothetical protein
MYEKTAGVRDAPPGCRGGRRGAADGARRGREDGIKLEGVGRARGGDRRRGSHGSRGRGRENSNREFSKKEASEVSGRLNLILPDWEVDQLCILSPSGRSDLLKKDSTRFFFRIHHRRSRRSRRGEVRRKLHLGIPLPLWRVLTCGRSNKCNRSVLPARR